MGAGKVGAAIACMLASSVDYEVHIADKSFAGADIQKLLKEPSLAITSVALDAVDGDAIYRYIADTHIETIVACLPQELCMHLVMVAVEMQCQYFDLHAEPSHIARIKDAAMGSESAFISQCGFAPGMLGAIAKNMADDYDEIESLKLRVGTLTEQPASVLDYPISRSLDESFNEYTQSYFAVQDGQKIFLKPLEDLESLIIDNVPYEAFNASGDMGQLIALLQDKVNTLNYKVLRYPGYCQKMKVLLEDFKVKDSKAVFKTILEHTAAKEQRDKVVLYVSIRGNKQQRTIEQIYIKHIYPQVIANIKWSALQIATAASLCALVEQILNQPKPLTGFITPEKIASNALFNNQFGHYFQE